MADISAEKSSKIQFRSLQSFSRIWLFVNPWTAACQASLSFTNSRSLLKLISIKSVMPSNHLILPAPYPPAFNLSLHILGSPLYSEIFVYVWPILFRGFCNKNKKGDIQGLIVSHLLLWLSHEKSPWENNKSKIWQYSITKIKVHWVDQLGLSYPAKLRKNIVWVWESLVSASSERCLCTC